MKNYQIEVLKILKNRLQLVEQKINDCQNQMQLDYISAYEKDVPTQLAIYQKLQIWLEYQLQIWLEYLYKNNFGGELTNDDVYHEVIVNIKWAIKSLFSNKEKLEKYLLWLKLELWKEVAFLMKDEYKFPLGDFSEY